MRVRSLFCFLLSVGLTVTNFVVLSSLLFVVYVICCCVNCINWSLTGNYNTALYDSYAHVLTALHSRNLRWIIEKICGIQLRCYLPKNLSMGHSYVVTINHRSIMDVILMSAVFSDVIPDFRFFLKRSLVWVQFLGWYAYLAGHIFLDRVGSGRGRPSLSKMADQRSRILKQCQQLFYQPVSIAVFVEGTRLTRRSKEKQTIYRHLLSPHSSGLAMVLRAGERQIDQLLDVTIAYDTGYVSGWLAYSGQVKQVEFHVNAVDIRDNQLTGDFSDRVYRKRLFLWIRSLWEKKDALLAKIYERWGV